MRPIVVVVVLALVLCLPFAACDSGRGLGGRLAAVSTVTAVGVNPTTVQVFWADTNMFEDGYKIERKSSPFAVVGTVGQDADTFIDSGLEPRKTYQYRIRAFSGGVFSDYSSIVTITPPLPPPPSLNSLSAGSAFAGTTVDIRGSGFMDFLPGPTTVLFGGVPSPSVTIVDDDNLTCEVPTGAAGQVDVSVGNLNGGAALTDSLTVFDYPPVFRSVNTGLETGAVVTRPSPLIRCNGTNVYASWSAGSDGIFFSRSTDGGANWSSPVRLDGAPTIVFAHHELHIDDQNAYVVWADQSSGLRLYINRSFDGGVSWQGETVIDSTPFTALAGYPKIASSGANIYLAYLDTQFGAAHAVFARSTDAGGTWEPAVRLDPGCTTVTQPSEIAASSVGLHVTWVGSCGGTQYVLSNSSTDGGANWLPQEARVDTGAMSPSTPKIAAEGSSVYVAWVDQRNGNRDVYFNRSTDSGTSFGPTDQPLENGLEDSASLQLCATANSVHTAWVQNTVQYRRSVDGGANFESATRLDSSVQADASVRLSHDDATIFATWWTAGAIYSNVSIDGGASFLAAGELLVNDTSPGNVTSAGEVCNAGPRSYVVFTIASDLYMNYNTPQ